MYNSARLAGGYIRVIFSNITRFQLYFSTVVCVVRLQPLWCKDCVLVALNARVRYNQRFWVVRIDIEKIMMRYNSPA